MNSEIKEIIWNIINSLLAGGLVLFGAISTGGIEQNSILIAIGASGLVAMNQFKDYWETEKSEYCSKKLGAFL